MFALCYVYIKLGLMSYISIIYTHYLYSIKLPDIPELTVIARCIVSRFLISRGIDMGRRSITIFPIFMYNVY